jgi:hypothetical protein
VYSWRREKKEKKRTLGANPHPRGGFGGGEVPNWKNVKMSIRNFLFDWFGGQIGWSESFFHFWQIGHSGNIYYLFLKKRTLQAVAEFEGNALSRRKNCQILNEVGPYTIDVTIVVSACLRVVHYNFKPNSLGLSRQNINNFHIHSQRHGCQIKSEWNCISPYQVECFWLNGIKSNASQIKWHFRFLIRFNLIWTETLSRKILNCNLR